MNPLPITCVVLDAFGTIVRLANNQRPFSTLRDIGLSQGKDMTNFFRDGMSRRHTVASQAQAWGIELTPQQHNALTEQVDEELVSLQPYADTYDALRALVDANITVIIGSNLGWPYGKPIERLLATHGSVSELGQGGQLQTAFSYDLGCIKPDRAFYERIAQAMMASGHHSNTIAMVGDKEREDVLGPQSVGWQATQLHRAQGDTLNQALERLGLSLPRSRQPSPSS